MATKKSSSAAKKQIAKKKSNIVKKQQNREEESSSFSIDDSAQASLQTAVKTSPEEATKKTESGNGIYLFLVLAGVAAIGYLGYAKYSSKKTQPETEPTKVEAPKMKEKKLETSEASTAPEEAAKASMAKFAVDKIESGKKWEEAISYCKSIGASLPKKQELADFSKDAPKELKTKDLFWANNTQKKTGNGYVFSFKNGKSTSTVKTEKHKVICKN